MSIQATPLSLPPRKRGPKTQKRNTVIEAIMRDLDASRLTIEVLHRMSDAALVDRYGIPLDAKRTLVREARDAALVEFVREKTPANYDK